MKALHKHYSHPLQTSVIAAGDSPCMPLKPVPVHAVDVTSEFWSPRMRANLTAGIPHLMKLFEEMGIIDNFRRLSGSFDGPRRGPRYTDSDVYKWLEAVGFVLQSGENPTLYKQAKAVIDAVVSAQGADEYINTYYVGQHADERYQDLQRSHELYCAGHLIQAAIAFKRATGDVKLFTAARRFADHMCRSFGSGKIETTDGHPEIELALVELYRETGNESYLELADFFIHQPQSMDDLPPIGQRPELVGHCVRSGYICSAAVDYCGETGDEAMLEHLNELWDDLVQRKMYITGGVGSRYQGEAYGDAYELPTARAYAESCAAIAHMMWAWRMLLVTGEARFADTMERILYNGFLSGVSLSGTEYFYRNPLASDGGDTRSEWYSTTCCPPNVQRILASLPGYMLSVEDATIRIHLYASMDAHVPCGDDTLQLSVETDYPWDGDISVTVEPNGPQELSLMLRIPRWASDAAAEVNGEPVEEELKPGSFLEISRTWEPGDSIELHLPMPVRILESNPRVNATAGKVALMRGPVVYCFEEPDNPEVSLPDIHLPAEALDPEAWEDQYDEDLLGGVVTLKGPAVAPTEPLSDLPLYAPAGLAGRHIKWKSAQLTAIPYYAWANRGAATMRVWIPLKGR